MNPQFIDNWLKTNIGYEYFNSSLDAISSALSFVQLDLKDKKIITIGGSNGKGETARILNSNLSNYYKTALWTSPHRYSVAERFCFNAQDIDLELLYDVFTETLSEIQRESIRLSYYEFLFLCFLKLCNQSQVLLLEVGLGGRLDAVNILDADIFILTSISRDHQEFLGHRYSDILKEKLGILRDKQKFYSALELAYLRAISRKVSKSFEITPIDLFENKRLLKSDDFSRRNFSLASCVLENEFGLTNCFRPQGTYYEFTKDSKSFKIFTSHNVDGVRKCIHLLTKQEYIFGNVFLFLSKRDLKDCEVIIRTLKQTNSLMLALVYFDHFKALPKNELKQLAKKFNLKVFNDYRETIRHTNSNSNLFLGSNYIVSDLVLSLQS